jgi:hypothetical protein
MGDSNIIRSVLSFIPSRRIKPPLFIHAHQPASSCVGPPAAVPRVPVDPVFASFVPCSHHQLVMWCGESLTLTYAKLRPVVWTGGAARWYVHYMTCRCTTCGRVMSGLVDGMIAHDLHHLGCRYCVRLPPPHGFICYYTAWTLVYAVWSCVGVVVRKEGVGAGHETAPCPVLPGGCG